MIYGYTRVSTEEQAASGAGLSGQRHEILRAYPLAKIVEETGTGTSIVKRPLFQQLLATMDRGDTLVVVKVDRFSRSVLDALTTLADLDQRGIGVVILSLNLDTSTPMGKMILGIMLHFAEFERDLISERTKTALAAKRREGVVLGRPKGYTEAQAMIVRCSSLSPTAIAKELGISRDKVNRIRKAAAQGGKV